MTGRVYVGNRADGTLTVLDAAREAVLATVDVGGSPGALVADGRRRSAASGASPSRRAHRFG